MTVVERTEPVAPLPASLPAGPRLPRLVSAALFLVARSSTLRELHRRHGDMFAINVPVFGHSVVVASPALVKQVFRASPDVLVFGEVSPLGEVLGTGSLFSMDGERHLRERRLILPAFHGERMRAYETIVAREAERELAGWPRGRPVATQPFFMRITLRAILRTVFGAEGGDVTALEQVLPQLVTVASRVVLSPMLRRDLGPGSPGRRLARLRERYEAIVNRMIDARRAEGDGEDRDDMLSMLLAAHYEDGSRMSRTAIADELLTLLAAGHETTATSLAWAVERISRHPDLLRRLEHEARSGDERALRMATIHEVQRARPVIVATSRYALADFPLGDHVIPRGHHIIVSAKLIHSDPRFFADPDAFDPTRFLDRAPDTYTWIPFGGGTRRCPGAAFAHMEMDVVLRTLLRTVDLVTTDRPGEREHDRGVAFAPAKGGRAVIRDRTDAPALQARQLAALSTGSPR